MDPLVNTDTASFYANAVYGRGLMNCESCGPRLPFCDLQALADLHEVLETSRDRDEVSERATPQSGRTDRGPSSCHSRFPEDMEEHTAVGGLPDLPPHGPPAGRTANSQTAPPDSSAATPREREATVGHEHAPGTGAGQAGETEPKVDTPALSPTVEALLKGKSSSTSASDRPFAETPRGGEEPTGRLFEESHSRLKGLQPVNLQGAVPEANAEGFTKGDKVGMGQSAGAEVSSEGPKGSPHMQFDVSALSSSDSVTSMFRGPGQSSVPVSVGPGGGGAATQNLGEQILDPVRVSLSLGDRQVLVRLNPPDLGTVLVRFREDDQQISAMLEVARGDTRRAIELALPQVLRGLQDAGVQVKRFEVVTSDVPEKDFARDQTQQDSSSEHQSSGHDHFAPASHTRWSQAGPDHLQRPAGEPVGVSQTEFPTGRIDMLL